ncbi:flagellar biosynthesis regulator FlaF [Acetobacter orientalis]|uniref:flagellar biosynthesis regulator FlaF n=1 Tax=Acetobacter orientalis TaxID=146474 RepID=UPI00248DA02A|nr:flagellar biosynthesis regulator FlaF [Acetobacter orientalis]
MINSAMKAYQQVADSSMTGRQADAACFAILIEKLQAAGVSHNAEQRMDALTEHQRLWSLIIKANALDAGVTDLEDRTLFVHLGNQAQGYAIRALLDSSLSLDPLIDIANNILDGLVEDENSVSNESEGTHNSADVVL